MKERDRNGVSRRKVLKTVSLAAVANQAIGMQADSRNSSVIGMKFQPRPVVRVGVIGVGSRGMGMLRNILALDQNRVTAVCDIVESKTLQAQGIVEKTGLARPAAYHDGDRAYEALCRREDVDFIYIAAPVPWHAQMARAAMEGGKHVGVEVPAATTLDDCWQLVNTSEKTRRHCMLMENCCYGYNELMALNMVKAGLFGDLVHGEAAYIHDTRELVFQDERGGAWRRKMRMAHDGNTYPTHGLGPVANYMGINRGDRFDYLVSMSSRSIGLETYRDAHLPSADPRRRERYKGGDMNSSLIRTANGLTILLQHDTVEPRPYERNNLISGTKGIFRDYPPRIYLDGQPGGENYAGIDKYKAQYEHPLWKNIGDLARRLGGHGGMDLVMLYRVFQCMREGLVPDIDVYDAASWSAPYALTEASVAQGSAPMKFPDFTRGRWKEKRGWLV